MNSRASDGRTVAGAGSSDGLQTPAALWTRVAASKQFVTLVKVKKRCTVSLFLFFAAYYLLLPLFTGYAPQLLARKIAGMSLAYVFGLVLILLAWAIVWFYVKAAAKFDVTSKEIISQAEQGGGASK